MARFIKVSWRQFNGASQRGRSWSNYTLRLTLTTSLLKLRLLVSLASETVLWCSYTIPLTLTTSLMKLRLLVSLTGLNDFLKKKKNVAKHINVGCCLFCFFGSFWFCTRNTSMPYTSKPHVYVVSIIMWIHFYLKQNLQAHMHIIILLLLLLLIIITPIVKRFQRWYYNFLS